VALRGTLAAAFAILIIFSVQGQSLTELAAIVDKEQIRLDMFDGKRDSSIAYPTKSQVLRGRTVFFETINKIQANIVKSGFPEAEKQPFYSHLSAVMQGLDKNSLRYLSFFDQYFALVQDLSRNNGTQKDLELLKNHVALALETVPFWVNRSYAEEVLKFSATKKPYDVLTKHQDYSRKPFFSSVLETVAHNDPNAVKQYMGAQHPVNTTLKASSDPVVKKLYEIFFNYGRTSSGYTNIHMVYNGEMTMEQSEALVRDDARWFARLCQLRRNPNILGSYSVDDQLAHHSLGIIRQINLLHDVNDERVRFALAAKMSSEEIYNLIVYSKDEIFTSTFLGLFKRMMSRRTDSSMYNFFKKLGFNRFRTFVQISAGYNMLQPVLNTMNFKEKDLFLDEMVRDLEKTGGNLSPAVEVADFYGSVTDTLFRAKMTARLKTELERCFYIGNNYGVRLYGLLYKLCGRDPQKITGSWVNFDVPDLSRVEGTVLFPDGKNVQQHMFYDDDDGLEAYNTFKVRFLNDANYRITEAADYTRIESVNGKKIVMYLNKPKSASGVESLRKLFESQNRYPDIVVHRGHSYHLGGTIDVLTNNAKVAILGSCGGFQNISRVLDNAAEAQIVSSKQIGTWTINNEILKEMNEMMRTGTGTIDWPTLWKKLDPRLKGNPLWKDYIPPHQNLGVKFVKAFQSL
jgi:hypothetical protein